MENGNVKARTMPGGTASKLALCTFHFRLFALKVAGTIKPSALALGYFVSDSVKEEVSLFSQSPVFDPCFARIKGIEKSAGILVKTQGR